MDKNQIFGFIIILALLIGYGIYTQPSKEELAEMQRKQDSLKRAMIEQRIKDSLAELKDSLSNKKIESELNTADTLKNDSIRNRLLKSSFGIFSNSAYGKQQFVTLENQKIKLKLTTKGAYPYFVELKEFKTWDKKPLILFDDNDNRFALKFYSDNKDISTADLYFVNMQKDTVLDASRQKQKVVLRLNAGEGKYIDYIYTMEPESYLVKFDIQFHGLERNVASNSSYLDIDWNSKIRKQEKGAKWENQNSTIYYKFYEDEVKYLTETADEKKEIADTRLEWIAYKDQFFSSVLIADDYLSSAEMSYVKDKTFEKYLKHVSSIISVPFEEAEEQHYGFNYYFGPNDYDILKNIKGKNGKKLDLERMIPLGWGIFRWVNLYIIIPLFNALGYVFGENNMGLIILIMTLIIKLVLFPFTFKSYKSSAKMRVLKPQIDEINKRIPKEKAMERQQATMDLYKRVGVNPMGGCLPILFQMPILIAMFRFFPASIELRQKSFLWAKDLSTYDSIWTFPDGFSIPWYGDHVSLFALLMAGAMLVSQLLNKNQMSGGNAQMPGMKLMLYMMPVMMVLWFNNYSAGLSYYYFLSNIITIIQTLLIRRMIDEDELLAKLNANKKKPKKKSKWQQRIEEMQKIQEQQQKNKKRRR
ncbi:MAG: membrane protein insertase YidC [Chlorobi bacterium]|nr:membrane protein insertase YidC [Chlorobiota bacterium]